MINLIHEKEADFAVLKYIPLSCNYRSYNTKTKLKKKLDMNYIQTFDRNFKVMIKMVLPSNRVAVSNINCSVSLSCVCACLRVRACVSCVCLSFVCVVCRRFISGACLTYKYLYYFQTNKTLFDVRVDRPASLYAMPMAFFVS